MLGGRRFRGVIGERWNMEINVLDLLKIGNPEQYKLHLGCINEDGDHPLDVFIENESEWKGWNEYRGSKNDWTRDYIFSLIEFYPKSNTWLFGGIFKVLERKEDTYVIEEVEDFIKYTGRLLLNFTRYQGLRGRSFRLEGYVSDITVNQIFEYKYSGEVFPGFENIDHSFHTLEAVFKLERSDWKNALENVKGVYLIKDIETGKMYIGSAYGDSGIWARWANYIGTLHGWNDQLVNLIEEKGPEYAKRYFKFTILEIHGMYSSDDQIISREGYWKEKLMTRTHGYNSN